MGGHGRWSSLQPFIDVSRTALDTLTPLTKLMFYSFWPSSTHLKIKSPFPRAVYSTASQYDGDPALETPLEPLGRNWSLPGAGAVTALISFAHLRGRAHSWPHSAHTGCRHNWSTIVSTGSLLPLSSSFPKQRLKDAWMTLYWRYNGLWDQKSRVKIIFRLFTSNVPLCKFLNFSAPWNPIFQMRITTHHKAGKPHWAHRGRAPKQKQHRWYSEVSSPPSPDSLDHSSSHPPSNSGNTRYGVDHWMFPEDSNCATYISAGKGSR